jgi:PEP-CTERM motif
VRLSSVLAAMLVLASSSSAYADSITIDTFNQVQRVAITPQSPSDSNTITGLDGVLGGSRTMSLSYLTPSPFFSRDAGTTASGIAEVDARVAPVSFVLDWDANGQGLGLDLTDMAGISIRRGDADAGLALAIRLISSGGNLFEFNTSTSAYDAPEIDPGLPGGAPGATPTYVFDRFTAIGAPDWAHISAIQVELSGSGSAAWVDDLRIVTPEPGTALLVGVGLLAAFRRRR